MAPMIDEMSQGEGKGRRAVVLPEMVEKLERVSPEERHEYLKRHLDLNGEDVETIDDWTPYGPHANRDT